jgi:GT2 family glycosyltransferase
MRVSVVILTCNRPQDLLECLDSLAAQTDLPSEVIILDNSSDRITSDLIAEKRATLPFKLLYMDGHPSMGTATGRNRASQNAEGDVVFFLDDDVVLIDQCSIETIVDIFRRDVEARIGGVAAGYNTMTPVRMLKLGARILLKTLFVLDSPRTGKVLPSGFRSWQPFRTAFVECLPGGTTAYRRVVLDELRFDPAYELFPYAMSEDQDFSYRAGLEWQLLWTNETQILHKGSPDGPRLGQYERHLSMVCNHHYFMHKNLGRPWNHAAFWWAMVGICLNCVVLLAARPCKDNADALRGFVQGIKMIAKTSIVEDHETP